MRIMFPYMARWHAVNWTRYHSLLHALAEIGHEVHVLQPPPLESLETNYQDIKPMHHKRVFVHDVFIPNSLWRKRFPLEKLVKKAIYCIVAAQVAKTMIASNPFDVLLLYNLPQFPLSTIRGPFKVFDYADDYIDMLDKEMGAVSNKAFIFIAHMLLKKMMKRADLVLSVSNELAKTGPVSMKVLPNGVARAALDDLVGETNVSVRNHNSPIVGFIGSFEYFIDFDTILGAAQLCPEFQFLLVGTGRSFETVRNNVRKMGLSNVKLTGGVPHPEVFRHIREMDVCLNIFMPFQVSHRACPIKLFEYWSQKKPVISSRLAELSYIDQGWLYFADTAQELAATIHRVISEYESAQQKAVSAYNAVKEWYTWEGIAQSFLKLVGEAGMPPLVNGNEKCTIFGN